MLRTIALARLKRRGYYAEQGDLGVFAAIEFDGANEVPHVFDEQDIDLVQIEST